MNTNALKSALVLFSLAGMLVGCAGDVGEPGGPGGDDLVGIDPTTGLPTTGGSSGGTGGTAYKGFAGSTLGLDRLPGELGTEERRVKPFSALTTEYARVLGKAPALLPTFASTFSEAPARWFEEPAASAVSMFSAYRAGFQGCLELTATDGAYASNPTAATAATVCTSLATKFWNRALAADEMATCVDVATNQTTKDTNPRRRWAYTCAAVLASAGFLTF